MVRDTSIDGKSLDAKSSAGRLSSCAGSMAVVYSIAPMKTMRKSPSAVSRRATKFF
jgi:hypothetical protein